MARPDQALCAELRQRLAQRGSQIAAYTLQRMALGPPADLLADSQRASADEAACLCEDEDARLILEQVAEDGARNAALAWRALHWLLDKHPRLRPLARQRLQAAPAADLPAQPGPDEGLSAHGLLITALNFLTARLREFMKTPAAGRERETLLYLKPEDSFTRHIDPRGRSVMAIILLCFLTSFVQITLGLHTDIWWVPSFCVHFAAVTLVALAVVAARSVLAG